MSEDAIDLWEKAEAFCDGIRLPPPFWAFAWAGGQALARYILDNFGLVRNRKVLDFAAGSGLIAIAAAKAGAARVEANEIDPFALAAIDHNAAENAVALTIRGEDLVGTDEGWDVVLAGDVSYERDMAARVTDWLQKLHTRGALVLIGDPGRSYLAREKLECVARYRVPVSRAIEDSSEKETSVWRFRSV
nr:50S ribosomal protein L11 methyltransferase [Beijerinckia indica]